MDQWGFATRAIHAGANDSAQGGATTVPIYQSSAFAYESAEHLADVFAGRKPGYVYSRIANPTVTAVERRIASLEGSVGAILLASGMAAVSTVVLSLASHGDEVVFHSSLFGGTFSLMQGVMKRAGIRTKFADLTVPGSLEGALSGKTRMVFVEAIGNPKLDVPNLSQIANTCHSRGIPLVADGTIATPYLWEPRTLGVDITVHSLTKYLTGNGSTIGGAICDTGLYDWNSHPDPQIRSAAAKVGREFAFLATARDTVTNTGASASPFDAYLQLLGIETLPLRMERHCENALSLARILEGQETVKSVDYPGLPANKWHGTVQSQFGGRAGGLITFRLSSQEQCFAVINRLKMAKRLANLGDSKTLVIHPASTIYRKLDRSDRESAGVFDDLIRVAVGIEDIGDIADDFSQALEGETRQ